MRELDVALPGATDRGSRRTAAGGPLLRPHAGGRVARWVTTQPAPGRSQARLARMQAGAPSRLRGKARAEGPSPTDRRRCRPGLSSAVVVIMKLIGAAFLNAETIAADEPKLAGSVAVQRVVGPHEVIRRRGRDTANVVRETNRAPRLAAGTRNCRDERKRPPRDASGGFPGTAARRGSASLPNSVGALGLAE